MGDQERIFREFPPVSTADWEKKIREDLGGADYEKKLIWRTAENLRLHPYYRQENLDDLGWLDTRPSEFPYTRGNHDVSNFWLIRQDLVVKDPVESNKEALGLLDSGVGSLGFILLDHSPSLATLLKEIPLQDVPVNIECYTDPESVLKTLSNLLRKPGIGTGQLTGSLEYDPLADFCMNRTGIAELDARLEKLPACMDTAEPFGKLRIISIRGDHYHNSGVGATAELAYSLAAGCEYLDRLTGAGWDIGRIAPRIQFHFATGPVYFMEIAKLRAARMLWSYIVNAYGPDDPACAKTFIHSSTSSWNMTLYDPHVNILRSTTEAMSAIIGGADSLSVLPFDHPAGEGTEFSRRIARNIQLILRDESYFDKVVDPGAGSYYIENLTGQLASQAWDMFLEIEKAGGFYRALRAGSIQQQVRESAVSRLQQIATRKEFLLGTNEYPDFEERLPEGIQPGKGTGVQHTRAASEFEALRYKTEQLEPVPSVFMFTIGPVAPRRARAGFACNFFACGGFRVIDNIGFGTIEEGLEAISGEQPAIVVLCSSDDRYPGLVEAIRDPLKKGPILVIAGHPENHVDTLSGMGIEHFIHRQSNVLEELRKFQELTAPGK